jgi:cytoskeleton protein RodZ
MRSTVGREAGFQVAQQGQGEQWDPHRQIGEKLQDARLAAGLTARQVTDRTRITAEVLHRIEAGQFDQCGGDVYARGHIRAYANAVGLDPEPLLAEYGAIRMPPLTRRDLRKPRVVPQSPQDAVGPAPVNERPAAFLAGAKGPAKSGPNWSIALIGALAAVGLVAAVQLWPDDSGGAAHAADSAAGKPAAVQAAPSHPAVAKPTVPAKPKTVSLRIVAVDAASWLGVTNSAGKQLFWNVLRPGESQQFSDASKLDVIVGDSAAVDMVVNGHDLGRQGPSGAVLRTSFDPASVTMSPTPDSSTQ